MNTQQQIITIALMGLSVMLTRFLPFILFPTEKHTPRFVLFLGKYLPSAVFGMLVVYCLKDIKFSEGTQGLPELIGIAITVMLHLWRKNMMLTIAGGTIAYMVMVQWIFS